MTIILTLSLTAFIAVFYVFVSEGGIDDAIFGTLIGIVAAVFAAIIGVVLTFCLNLFASSEPEYKLVQTQEANTISVEGKKNTQYVAYYDDGTSARISDQSFSFVPLSSYTQKELGAPLPDFPSDDSGPSNEEQASARGFIVEEYAGWNAVMELPVYKYVVYVPDGTVLIGEEQQEEGE